MKAARRLKPSDARALEINLLAAQSKAQRSRISAGLLMFRRKHDDMEVLLAHPGGPFFARKDDGVWTIPKGEAMPDEDLFTRAQIEFEEEVGFRPENVRRWINLGWIKQKGGKIVHAWAFEGDLPESFECKSNLFDLEWPPRSGKYQQFPEVDQACFFSDETARRKLKATQVPLLDRLRSALNETGPTEARPTIS
ncbi:MAG TPA: NUDIX domain-containing protein [Candidatus Udaeobacter sp.]|nr:NUDIX domain-containing protein [Candidatus Udaeobacter sp.]